jgi:hypothetical protein
MRTAPDHDYPEQDTIEPSGTPVAPFNLGRLHDLSAEEMREILATTDHALQSRRFTVRREAIRRFEHPQDESEKREMAELIGGPALAAIGQQTRASVEYVTSTVA